tara:strand:- start:363 stop:1199 length:837 start_codon:yes stop_codon:yes gene_type:complete
MREYSQQCKRDGKTIASVDTAGDLHEGHMSLVKIGRDNADVVILSISHTIPYVKFSPELYEKHLEEYKQIEFISEIEFCKSHGVDVFGYLPDSSWNFEVPIDIPFPYLKRLMKHRDPPPMGIDALTMWPQILDVERPDVTILGQKDIYQNFVVKSIIDKLSFPIKVIIAPTIRDSDGLAYSSRNRFLTPSERRDATSIYQTLHEVSRWSTYPSIEKIKEHITNRINQVNGSINYIDICCSETLKELASIDREAIIIISTIFSKLELTDNIIIKPQGTK